MGGEAITPGEAVFTSEFGTVVTVKNTNTVDLIPATYTFDLSDGEFRHVRGTLEVKEGTTLTAQLPAGQWIKSVGIGIDNYWKTYGEMPKQDVPPPRAPIWCRTTPTADFIPILSRVML